MLAVSRVLEGIEITDIATQTSDRTFWVLGSSGVSATTHRIYHLSNDLSTQLGFCANPHPPGTIAGNDLTTNRGIAYRSISGTIFVMSAVGPRETQTLMVKEVDPTTCSEIPAGAFSVNAPDGSTGLFGLTYDLFSRNFWALDAQNDRVLRIDASGNTLDWFAVPGKRAANEVLLGQGIAFNVEGTQPRVNVTYGNIFTSTEGPIKIMQLETTGALIDSLNVGVPTGIEVPLANVPTSNRRGFDFFQIGQLRHVALVGANGLIYDIEQVVSDPVPPSGLSCSLNRTNQVELTWTNHGGGLDNAYAEIQILRNGVAFQTISGFLQSFTDTTPVNGVSTYSLRASNVVGGPLSAAGLSCEVTVGSGGLIDWTPVPGLSVHDVALHPVTGDVYVTDDLDVTGTIYVFDHDLDPVGEISSPWTDPGGIAFVPGITVGFPPPGVRLTDVLAVVEASGRRLRLWELDNPGGSASGTTITLQIPNVASPQFTGLSFDPITEEFIAREASEPSKVFRFDSNGNFVSSCDLSVIQFNTNLHRGITFDPIRQTSMAVFDDNKVREIFTGGAVCTRADDFQIDLGSSVGGIQIDGNTLLLTARGSQALLRILIFPFGPTFVRGDFNADAAVNATDAINVTEYLFRSGPAPSCQDAADCNDDGILDVADPVYLLFWLFVANTPPPPEPYPDPGGDPTFRDNLGCTF